MLAAYDAGDAATRTRLEEHAMIALESVAFSNGYVQRLMHQRPMFCMPKTANVTASDTIQAIRRVIVASPDLAEVDFEGVVLFALVRDFPCS